MSAIRNTRSTDETHPIPQRNQDVSTLHTWLTVNAKNACFHTPAFHRPVTPRPTRGRAAPRRRVNFTGSHGSCSHKVITFKKKSNLEVVVSHEILRRL